MQITGVGVNDARPNIITKQKDHHHHLYICTYISGLKWVTGCELPLMLIIDDDEGNWVDVDDNIADGCIGVAVSTTEIRLAQVGADFI